MKNKPFKIEEYYNPNRPIEPAVKRKKSRGDYAAFYIGRQLGPAMLEKEKIAPAYGRSIVYADDEFLVYDYSFSKGDYLLICCGILLFYIFLILIYLISLLLDHHNNFDLDIVIMISYGFQPFVYYYLYKAFWGRKDKKVIFDRLRGLVQAPTRGESPFGEWSDQLIRFEDLHVIYAAAPGGGLLHLLKNKTIAEKYFVASISLPMYHAFHVQSWSFFVWYMDRNRPLPLGTALDPYREKDYQRRKAAGMPEPLYDSAIATPEHFDPFFVKIYLQNRQILGRYHSLNSLYKTRMKRLTKEIIEYKALHKKLNEIEKKAWPIGPLLKVITICRHPHLYLMEDPEIEKKQLMDMPDYLAHNLNRWMEEEDE